MEAGAHVMTDHQYDGILKMVLLIMDGCSSMEDAKKKIESLLRDKGKHDEEGKPER